MNLSFARLVYKAVAKIPKGKVSTYKEIARAIKRPRAWRAVGNALSKNTDPKIPCHRVVNSNLTVGGFSKGVKQKISKLMAEGIKVHKGKVGKEYVVIFSSL